MKEYEDFAEKIIQTRIMAHKMVEEIRERHRKLKTDKINIFMIEYKNITKYQKF